jgi:transposase
MHESDLRLAELIESYPGAKAPTTVPGVSVVCAATLVAELGSPESYVAPRQVLKLAGMNLAGRESGTSIRGRIKATKRGRPLRRRQLFLLAARWCSKRGLYREQYLAMCKRNGGKKISAMCGIARKLVPMLLHIVQTGESFDEAQWRAAQHVSPYRNA